MALRPYREHSPALATSTYVDPQAAVIGRVTIGPDSSVWPMCALRGDVNSITVGARTNLQDGTIVHGTHPREPGGGHAVTIGDDVTIGHQCLIHGCTIESRCLIGMGSQILDGAVLKSGAFLGAGSLVTGGKVLEGGYLWLGRPARRVRLLTAEETAMIGYLATYYVELKNDHLA